MLEKNPTYKVCVFSVNGLSQSNFSRPYLRGGSYQDAQFILHYLEPCEALDLDGSLIYLPKAPKVPGEKAIFECDVMSGKSVS